MSPSCPGRPGESIRPLTAKTFPVIEPDDGSDEPFNYMRYRFQPRGNR